MANLNLSDYDACLQVLKRLAERFQADPPWPYTRVVVVTDEQMELFKADTCNWLIPGGMPAPKDDQPEPEPEYFRCPDCGNPKVLLTPDLIAARKMSPSQTDTVKVKLSCGCTKSFGSIRDRIPYRE